jgi:hypothetical protein
MRNRIWIVLIALFSATCFVAAHYGVNQDEPLDVEKKIVELQKQRRDILKERVKALESKHNDGQIQVMQVIHARDDLYLAELELVSLPEERVHFSKLRLQNVEELEEVATLRHANGVGTFEEKLVAVAARIQAEIDLLNERAKIK